MDGQVSADSGPSTLAVWHYDSPMGAAAGEIRLRVLEVRETLAVVDTLGLLWLPGTPEPRIGRFRARDVAAGRAGASPRAAARSLLLAPAPKDRGRTGSEAALLDDRARRVLLGGDPDAEGHLAGRDGWLSRRREDDAGRPFGPREQ